MSVRPSKYNIITISATNLLKRCDERKNETGSYISYDVDYTDVMERRFYLQALNECEDTALFYQIRQELGLAEAAAYDPNALRESLIYVDFDRLFSWLIDNKEDVTDENVTDEDDDKEDGQTTDYKLRQLFAHGINIKFAEDWTVNFVPFDKSNNMARDSRMTFIDRSLLQRMNRRLNLDLTFPNYVNLSKFYAYRGLYLSGAKRVDLPANYFDSEKVIIINDVTVFSKPQRIVTAERADKEKQKWQLKEECGEQEINAYDGEGIISPGLAQRIRELIKDDKGITSFQIRMPFAKGMLHEVDFHRFIREEIGRGDSFIIRDAFGCERDLLKAEIVMPISMLKCHRWLKDEFGGKTGDHSRCMDYYFENFYKYDHALYISNFDVIYGKSGLTRLNYQFLNTLALTDDEFASIVNEHLSWADRPADYFMESRGTFETGDEDDDRDDISAAAGSEQGIYEYALKKRPVLARETGLRQVLTGISSGLKQDCARGKLLAKGEIRYLARDLLCFLLDLVKNGISREKYKALRRQCMFQDEFYMPGSRLKLEYSKRYPLFRSPHLSRNEQCVLTPYLGKKEHQEEDIYNKYFSHLTSAIMIAYKSMVAHTLGGADFDGDTVKIFADERIKNAVLRGVYEKPYKRPLVRKLPIVVIPSIGNEEKPVTDEVSYRIIKDTFANRIGQISNLSIKLGKYEYGKKPDIKHSCVECTILTGLEIDAAKTGKHPDLGELVRFQPGAENDYSYIKDFKNEMDKLRRRDIRLSGSNVVPDETGRNYTIKVKNRELLSYSWEKAECAVERLPGYYFDSLRRKIVLPGEGQKIGARNDYFNFLKDKEWEEKLDEKLRGKIGAVMEVYYALDKLGSNINKRRKYLGRKDRTGRIITTLQMQYDMDSHIAQDECWRLLEAVEPFFEAGHTAAEAEAIIREKGWPFLYTDSKDIVMDTIVTSREMDAVGKLRNFDAMGYSLLSNVISTAQSLRELAMTDQELAEMVGEENDEPQQKAVDWEYYAAVRDEIYNMYIGWRDEKLADENNASGSRGSITKRLLEECNRRILELLAELDDEKQKTEMLFSLCGSSKPDRRSIFLWKNMTAADIDYHCGQEAELHHDE